MYSINTIRNKVPPVSGSYLTQSMMMQKSDNNAEFTKYVPPHMRRKERRRRRNNKNGEKKSSHVIVQVDLQDKTQFPVLHENSEQQENNNGGNMNWIQDSKQHSENYETRVEETDETFQYGHLNFKLDKNVNNGWLVLNKDANLNRGNCKPEDLIPLSLVERKIEYENYVRMMENVSRNSEGIPLIPKHYTPFDYDTDEDLDQEIIENNEEYLGEYDNEYEGHTHHEQVYINSDYSDIDDDYYEEEEWQMAS